MVGLALAGRARLMARLKRAEELRKREQFLLVCANGKALATLQGIEEGLTERDLAPPEIAAHVRPDPVIGLHVMLSRAVLVPDVPGWRMQLMTIWARPGDLFEPYV
jgi:hypothetical protein